MKTIFYLLVANFFLANLSAQEYSKGNSVVTRDELTMQNYPADKSAPALVLHDIGHSWFMQDAEGGFDVVFERSTKIKIFTEAGLKYAEVSIPFYHEGSTPEVVKDIEAVTYNMAGEKINPTKLAPKNTYTEKINERWSLLKFAIPDVKPGSVIEYKYTIVSPYFNLRDWEFQAEIPVKYSKYKVEMIPFYTYTFLLQGASKFDSYTSYESTGLPQQFRSISYKNFIHEYIMNDVPAFYDEGFITSKDDYILKLDFQLSTYYSLSGAKIDVISTWPALCNDILKENDFGKYINSAQGNNKELIEKLKTENQSQIDIIEDIVDHVKRNYSWNGRNSWFSNKTVKEFEKTKIGNSAEINLYLLGLLLDAGIDASPVILSTRDNGKIKTDFPFMHFFNYAVVLVQLPNESFLLDATEPLLPFYLLPPKCLNDKGLVVQKKSNNWVELTNNNPSKLHTAINISINSTMDSINAFASITSDRYDAFYLRKQINDEQKKLTEYIEDKQYNDLSNISMLNFYERNKAFIISFSANYPVDKIMDKIYISPFLNEPIKESPLKQPDRKYPIDLTYSKERMFFSTVNIPKGYKVEFLPGEKTIDDNLFSFTYKALANEEGAITITSKYCFKKSVYDANEYRLLKYYFTELVNKLNEKVVLVKIQ